MGLFGSIGKVFGGALKVAGKVAGVASAIAPIPGLGFAGKAAAGLGGILGKVQRARGTATRILGPGTLTALSSTMPGGSQANQTFFTSGYAGSGAGPGGVAQTARAISKRMGGKKRKKRAASSRRRSSRRKRRGLTRAQLAAGFGGRRRMRRR